MIDVQEGHRILKQAASLGPEQGMLRLSVLISSQEVSVADVLVAARTFRDPTTKELRSNTPMDIRLLLEAFRNSLIS